MSHPFFSLFLLLPLSATELYFTDFKNFTEGNNNWVGTDGWQGSEEGNNVDSILGMTAFSGNFGLSAALGAAQPDSRRVSVFRALNHDHLTSGESLIEISTIISVKDSTNDFRDDFFISVFNSTGARLASIRLDNEDPGANNSNFGIWREDGIRQFDTTVDFIHEEPYDLFLKINLEKNTWSADIDGVPLFEDQNFTQNATGTDINLGFIGYEWQLTSNFPSSHGDNFLFVADLSIFALPDQLTAPEVSYSSNDNGQPTLTWFAQADFTYQLQYSDDLMHWKDDLPDSLQPETFSSRTINYTDTSADRPAQRFYRVIASDPNKALIEQAPPNSAH